MPNSLNLLDIAKFQGNDRITGLIESSIQYAPELSLLPARTIVGTEYRTLIRESIGASAFRKANEGSAIVNDTYANKLVQCFYLDGQMQVDKMVADGDGEGADHALSLVESGRMEAHMRRIGRSVYYGTNAASGDALGFPGLLQAYDATNRVVDAGGTTAATGSSVWFVKLDEQFLKMVFGKNALFAAGPWRTQQVKDGDGDPFTAYVNALEGWVGLQTVRNDGIVRIKKLTADSGKGLTDSLGIDALDLFPSGITPDYAFMTRRSRTQLRKSRITTEVKNPPMPTDIAGAPIIVTDSILNTEALTL